MKPKMMYIEQKTGEGAGRAWIGSVSFSKSGRTLYYRNMAFTKGGGRTTYGNHYGYDKTEFAKAANAKLEEGANSGYIGEFWISGPKKNGEDRSYEYTNSVIIDDDIAEEYKKFRNRTE